MILIYLRAYHLSEARYKGLDLQRKMSIALASICIKHVVEIATSICAIMKELEGRRLGMSRSKSKKSSPPIRRPDLSGRMNRGVPCSNRPLISGAAPHLTGSPQYLHQEELGTDAGSTRKRN